LRDPQDFDGSALNLPCRVVAGRLLPPFSNPPQGFAQSRVFDAVGAGRQATPGCGADAWLPCSKSFSVRGHRSRGFDFDVSDAWQVFFQGLEKLRYVKMNLCCPGR